MLIGIFGEMGSGKTLIMSILATELHRKGIPVYSNMASLKERTGYVGTMEAIEKIDNGMVALDEFWLSVDSRLWKNNVYWSRWILQTRKKNLLVAFTTQTTGQVDIRIRMATNLWIFCEKLKKKRYFRYSFLSGSTNSHLKSFKISFEGVKKHFEGYDTYEVLKPLISYVKSNKQ